MSNYIQGTIVFLLYKLASTSPHGKAGTQGYKGAFFGLPVYPFSSRTEQQKEEGMYKYGRGIHYCSRPIPDISPHATHTPKVDAPSPLPLVVKRVTQLAL